MWTHSKVPYSKLSVSHKEKKKRLLEKLSYNHLYYQDLLPFSINPHSPVIRTKYLSPVIVVVFLRSSVNIYDHKEARLRLNIKRIFSALNDKMRAGTGLKGDK